MKHMETDHHHLKKFMIDHQSRLATASMVSDSGSFIYLETPKAACSTMKYILMELEGHQIPEARQLTADIINGINVHHKAFHKFKSLTDLEFKNVVEYISSKKVYRFCVVRNPYARLVSAWTEKISQKNPHYAWCWKKINNHHNIGNTEHCPTFAEFVSWLEKQEPPETCDAHWRSMTLLLFPEHLAYTHILKTETLIKDLQYLLDQLKPGVNAEDIVKRNTKNESLPQDWRACYNEEIAETVHRRYLSDFENFGYAADSWKTSAELENAKQTTDYWRKKYFDLEQKALTIIRQSNDTASRSAEIKDALIKIILKLKKR